MSAVLGVENANIGPLTTVRIRSFRSAHDIVLKPGPITALIGEAGSGKSNLLLAIWKLLAADCAHLEPADHTKGLRRSVQIEAALESGNTVRVAKKASGSPREQRAGTPPAALFLPASQRADGLVAAGTPIPRTLQRALAGSASGALALTRAFDAWLEEPLENLVVMIEEPELFLRPQAQRGLYRLLREFAAAGNQVLYSTHAATFLNVARLDEIALVRRDSQGATTIRRPKPLAEPDVFRALSEFDAERSELLLARAALLVEGRTEKLVFPFLFRALGYDADAEGISIVECGGKPNIPVIAQVCNAVGIPYLVVHDRDAAAGSKPIASERAVNETIARIAGAARTVELVRDFEAVADLHGRRHKPERAWHWFALAESTADIPEKLAEIVHRTVKLARNGPAARRR